MDQLATKEPITTVNGLEANNLVGLAVCWIDSTRYTQLLDATQEKKWRALRGLGVEMYVTGFSTTLRARRFDQHAHFYLYPQPPVRVLRYLILYLWATPLALWLILRKNVRVLVVREPHIALAGAVAKQIARLFGKRAALIVESHGDFEQVVFQQRQILLKGLYRRIMRTSAAYSFHQADVLRAISDATRAQLERWSPDKPITQFMTWTDAEAFTQIERPAPPSQSDEILYVGVLVPGKGVHVLIDAFAQVAGAFPSARLKLIGRPENPEYADGLHEQIERLGLTDRVSFHGAMPQPELARHMAGARVLVLPSFSEGLGRVLVEAMMCGTPCIGSKVDGIPEIIKDGVNGYLVPPDDVAALAGRLRDVLASDVVDTMGERAQTFARAFFSPEAYVAGYARTFELARQAVEAQ